MGLKFRRTAVILLCMVLMGMTACNFRAGKNTLVDLSNVDEYKIILLGKESYVYADKDFISGMELAIEEEASEGVRITWEHLDDNGEYERGILYGEQAAKDASVLAVFTFQDFEVIEALAPVYEEQRKPLISVQGCYETTLQGEYTYFLSAFTSAQDMGKAAADYCQKKGYERVACSHTDTTFELEEMRGFQRQASENNLDVVDMVQGPDTATELQSIFYQWKKLKIDAVYLAQYTYSDTTWMLEIIRYLKEQQPDLLIISDYSLNNEATLEEYGDILEGVVIPAPYSIEECEKTECFRQNYWNCYQTEPSNVAVQSYDLIHIFADILKNGCRDSEDLIFRLKCEEGFEGASGTLRFDKDGRLTGIQPQYLIVKDKKFVEVE